MVLLPVRRAPVKSRLAVNLVNEDVAAVAVIDNTLARHTVTRYYNCPVRRLKTKSKCLGPSGMLYQKGFDGDVRVLIDNARRYFMRIDSKKRGLFML